ncbi:MAG: sensor histidine kinase [Thermomicrobiales bacterium]
MAAMNVQARSSALSLAAAMTTWSIAAACFVTTLLLDQRLSSAGRSDLRETFSSGVVYAIPIISAIVVGSALVIRRPHHPVGWLFLLLSVAITIAGVIDGYAAYGAVAKPGSLPGAQMAAVIGARTYVPWLMLLGFVLLLTPSGRLNGRFARLAAWAIVVGGVVGFGSGLFRPYEGDYAKFGTVRNPLEVSRGTEVISAIEVSGIVVLHLGVLAGAAAIVIRFRAARADERLQLRWLGMAAIPFVLFVLGAFIAAALNNDVFLQLMAGSFVAIIPLAVGLSVEQYHLYDVDRLVSRAVTWLVLTAAVIATYVVVVVFVGQSIGRAGDSEIPAVIATLAAVSVALPLRHKIQDTLDRRFNRRRFETLAMLRAFSREPTPTMTVEQALRTATGDPTLGVAYWIGERETWVSEAGLPVTPATDGVTVQRREETVCVVSFDGSKLDRPTIEAAAAEVLTELENARLRANITLQLVEVRESRARIVEAQLAERHKIERDLHDGAQQRLLGLAMQLRAVEMSGDTNQMQTTVATAVDELQAAVRELRELANGLRPAVLTDGGLAAALDDLAARSPVPVRLEMTGERFAPNIEETAWFIACEVVTNAVKHAAPHSVAITTCRIDGRLRLVIEDDGIGGADPAGSGLRGIADRAEVAGGTLTVQSHGGHGTIVIAELPCASS